MSRRIRVDHLKTEVERAQEYQHGHQGTAQFDWIMEALRADIVASHEEEKKERLKRLMEWTPEGLAAGFKDGPYYAEGDEDAPFFTEAYLYNLLGKEDARTLLALMRPVFEEAGVGR